jgi:hypothetical protein
MAAVSEEKAKQMKAKRDEMMNTMLKNSLFVKVMPKELINIVVSYLTPVESGSMTEAFDIPLMLCRERKWAKNVTCFLLKQNQKYLEKGFSDELVSLESLRNSKLFTGDISQLMKDWGRMSKCFYIYSLKYGVPAKIPMVIPLRVHYSPKPEWMGDPLYLDEIRHLLSSRRLYTILPHLVSMLEAVRDLSKPEQVSSCAALDEFKRYHKVLQFFSDINNCSRLVSASAETEAMMQVNFYAVYCKLNQVTFDEDKVKHCITMGVHRKCLDHIVYTLEHVIPSDKACMRGITLSFFKGLGTTDEEKHVLYPLLLRLATVFRQEEVLLALIRDRLIFPAQVFIDSCWDSINHRSVFLACMTRESISTMDIAGVLLLNGYTPDHSIIHYAFQGNKHKTMFLILEHRPYICIPLDIFSYATGDATMNQVVFNLIKRGFPVYESLLVKAMQKMNARLFDRLLKIIPPPADPDALNPDPNPKVVYGPDIYLAFKEAIRLTDPYFLHSLLRYGWPSLKESELMDQMFSRNAEEASVDLCACFSTLKCLRSFNSMVAMNARRLQLLTSARDQLDEVRYKRILTSEAQQNDETVLSKRRRFESKAEADDPSDTSSPLPLSSSYSDDDDQKEWYANEQFTMGFGFDPVTGIDKMRMQQVNSDVFRIHPHAPTNAHITIDLKEFLIRIKGSRNLYALGVAIKNNWIEASPDSLYTLYEENIYFAAYFFRSITRELQMLASLSEASSPEEKKARDVRIEKITWVIECGNQFPFLTMNPSRSKKNMV